MMGHCLLLSCPEAPPSLPLQGPRGMFFVFEVVVVMCSGWRSSPSPWSYVTALEMARLWRKDWRLQGRLMSDEQRGLSNMLQSSHS